MKYFFIDVFHFKYMKNNGKNAIKNLSLRGRIKDAFYIFHIKPLTFSDFFSSDMYYFIIRKKLVLYEKEMSYRY